MDFVSSSSSVPFVSLDVVPLTEKKLRTVDAVDFIMMQPPNNVNLKPMVPSPSFIFVNVFVFVFSSCLVCPVSLSLHSETYFGIIT